MQRRKFIIATALAAPFAAMARFSFPTLKKQGSRPGKGMIIKPGENRYFGKATPFTGGHMRCVISGADTDSNLYICDSHGKAYEELGGPGLHIHHKEDEIFYVVSGEFLFQLGDDYFIGKEGDTIFIPRGSAHTFANFTPNNPGRMITIHQPITPELEKFYEAFNRIGYMSGEDLPKLFEPEEFATLMENNTFVGPPIDIPFALKKLGIKR